MTLSIILQVDPTYMGSLLTNNAEITSATNALGLPDEDNVIDGSYGSTDIFGRLNTDSDIDDEAVGTPGVSDVRMMWTTTTWHKIPIEPGL
ncbi:MAG: hypothetical protein R2766_02680 [Saprospiraceae bacterium]